MNTILFQDQLYTTTKETPRKGEWFFNTDLHTGEACSLHQCLGVQSSNHGRGIQYVIGEAVIVDHGQVLRVHVSSSILLDEVFETVEGDIHTEPHNYTKDLYEEAFQAGEDYNSDINYGTGKLTEPNFESWWKKNNPKN